MATASVRFEDHRAALTGHCYRMLGSVADADDAVQETMVRAWRSYERFDGRSSLRTWLHRIATNTCLDALSDRSHRARPFEEGPSNTVDDEIVAKARTHWLEPIAEAHAIPADIDPSERAVLRQSIRLAFVAALQRLPPKQRAALLLTEVLDWSAAEVADALDTSVEAINSALQRARATMRQHDRATEPAELTEGQRRMLDRYVDAFHRYDVDGLTALLREDATLSMPPYSFWLQGPETIHAWLNGRGSGCRGSRLVEVAAGGAPAFAQYRPKPEGGHAAWALIVLELDGESIRGWNSFLDVETHFPRLGLVMELPA